MDIIKKIKDAQLVGRGGACFPADVKWQAVKDVESKDKYVICNASEGEPDVGKDGYILENHPARVIEGMKLARQVLEKEARVKCFIYINHEYYVRYKENLEEAMGQEDIEFFIKPEESGYIGGEESALLNTMQEERTEPRLKPPFPTTNGLWGKPTLVNNVETFYNVSLVHHEEYENKRFYTLNGKVKNKGVYEFPVDRSIEKILKETGNYPSFDFFVQVGGGASGPVLNSKQLKRRAEGAGSITVYKVSGHSPRQMLRQWLRFFINESCGQCTTCREGVYRLTELMNKEKVNWHLAEEILDNLKETSFCGLGCAVPVPITSYINNVLSRIDAQKIKLSSREKERICHCFNK